MRSTALVETTENIDQNDNFGKASKIRDTIPRISTNKRFDELIKIKKKLNSSSVELSESPCLRERVKGCVYYILVKALLRNSMFLNSEIIW